MKLYTLGNQFIEKTNMIPLNFTGIIKYSDGVKYTLFNGRWHNLNGPAIECANGTKEWYIDGKRHRIGGPAVEFSNGMKQWWVDGEQIIKEQCELLHSIIKLKGLL